MPSQHNRTRPPWHFRLAKWVIRRGLRGGFRLLRLSQMLCRGVLVTYELPGGLPFSVPIYETAHDWDEQDVSEYEDEVISAFARALKSEKGSVTLIDVGADIGTFSCALVTRCRAISEVIAIEPSPSAQPTLRLNLARLPLKTQLIAAGASNFCGEGVLSRADYDPSDCARFVIPGPGGIAVTTIDALNVSSGHLALKIDVEGSELAVLQGAACSLRSSRDFTVIFECHPAVIRRTGVDAIECLRFLNDLRAIRFWVAERPDVTLSLSLPLMAQVPDTVTNIICVTRMNGPVDR